MYNLRFPLDHNNKTIELGAQVMMMSMIKLYQLVIYAIREHMPSWGTDVTSQMTPENRITSNTPHLQ